MESIVSLALIAPLLLAWVGCFCLARELGLRNRVDPDWRLSWILASIAFGSLLTLIVEIGSLAHALNRSTLAVSWLVAASGLFFAVFRLRRQRPPVVDPLGKKLAQFFRVCPIDAKLTFGAALLVVVFLFFVALLTPTSNADSRAYHLPRMMHWIQQGSVDHFQTDDLRQLEFGPFSSFVMTNLFLLWGNDRLLNLVQWFAMASSVIVVTWLAKHLASFLKRNQETDFEIRRTAFVALLAATLPIGMVESISTQNDYSTAFWVLCLFSFTVVLARNPTNAWYVAGAGLAAGLGALTKATTYMYAGPLILGGATWWYFRGSRSTGDVPVEPAAPRCPWAIRWRMGFLFAGCFFALNAPHMLRNYALFGSPLGSPEIMSMERNDRISPRVVASNAIRNLVLHTSTPVSWITERLNDGVGFLHRLTGENLNDPATTFRYCRFDFPHRFLVSDSWASCAVHLTLCIVAGLLLLIRLRQNCAIAVYVMPTLASLLFFCAFLKWQAWHTRIQLAWFLLLVPAAAILICQQFPRWAVKVTSGILLAFAACTIAMNSSRPVFRAEFRSLPREEKYYALEDRGRNEAYKKLASNIVASKFRNIGLKADSCEAEYPLWVMLRNRGFRGRIDRCFVENVSARIPSSAPTPEMIISIFNVFPEAVSNAYPRIERFADLTVLWPEKPLYAASPQ